MNAYDAYKTFKSDFGNIQYYGLKNGLSNLCELMKKRIEKNGSKVCLRSKVYYIKKNNSNFVVKYKKNNIIKNVNGFKIIFAIKPSQLKEFNILSPIFKHINSVYNAPLIRIYAKYDEVWFKNINRTTTNNILRQIIPISKENGLIMVSYTDGIDTKPFLNKNKLKNDKILRNIVKKNLQKLFPNIKIPDPIYFKAHLWTIGCHHWLPKYNSTIIQKEIINPLENVYICGEGFSKKQAWIEGALESSNNVLLKIHKN
tara:strand:- start:228 stop:998 length:771 start_codon:yes stop_codon:yes gene_type:complete